MTKVLPIAIAIFLFAASPLFVNVFAASPSSSTHIAAPSISKEHYPNANGPLVAYTGSRVNPLGNKDCPTGKVCTVIADGIGGVQVEYKNKIIASVFVPSSLSGTYTCPEGVISVSSTMVLVTDPCGNDYAGAAYPFNPQTETFGSTAWTNVGSEPIFGVTTGGNVYITNFGYSEITVVSTSDTAVTTLATCGFYPEFIVLSGGLIYESNQEGYDSSTGNYAGCIDQITPSSGGGSVTATLWGDATNGPGADEELTGIQVVGGDIYVNSPYYYNGYLDGATFMATSMTTWSSAGALIFAQTANNGVYILWGMASSSTSAFPVSVYNYPNTDVFSETGFTFSITGTTVSTSAHSLGGEPEFTCTGSGTTSVLPDYLGGSSGYGVFSVLTPPSTTHTYGTWYGIVESYGCASN